MKIRLSFNHLAAAMLTLPIAWLVFSAIVLDIEYYDGLDVILNSHYFLGEYPSYLSHKAPMLAIVMIPALLISKLLHLTPLNLLVYHMEMASLHIAYLLIIFYLMVKTYGKQIPVLIAYAAAVLNFVFFSYGLFMNIDIFPGLLFLTMILLAESFKGVKDWKIWIFLAIIGAFAAALKQTFGLFWFAVLVAQTANLLILKDWSNKAWIRLLLLGVGSVTSFILYILLMCFVLKDSHMQGGFFANPFIQILNFSKEYSNPEMIPPIWIYAVNFPFYGILTTLLIIPGIILGLKSQNRQRRSLTICWIVAFIIMHIICRREVRYIAFLAPLSAFIIVEPIIYLIKKPRYLYLILLVLAVDLLISGMEGGRVLNPFYRESQLKKFMAPLCQTTGINTCIANDYLCFMPPIKPAFLIDHYHRKFHFSPYHMQFFMGQQTKYKYVPFKSANLIRSLPYTADSFLIYCNLFPINLGETSKKIADYLVLFSVCKTLPERPIELLIIDQLKTDKNSLTYKTKTTFKDIENYIFPCVFDTKKKTAFPLIQLDNQSFRIDKPAEWEGDFPDLETCEFRGYQIQRFIYMKNNGTSMDIITEKN